MVANIFENRNFMQPMTKLRVLNFFPFWVMGVQEGGFICCLSVRIKFSNCSFSIPNNNFLPHIVWLCFNFHVYIVRGE